MMQDAIESPRRFASATPEVERQLAAAVERHREVVAAMREPGRPESGQHVAVKAVGRAVHLVIFTLRHAAENGVPVARLIELTGWERELVEEALVSTPQPGLVARLAPAGLDPDAVAQAAATIEATARLQALMQRTLADVRDGSPAPADLVDLHQRLDGEWRSWRQALAPAAVNAR